MRKKELLKIIEQAAQSDEIILNLSGQGITELPEEIRQLSNLQTLDLRRNRLSTLSESFGELMNLQTLDL